MIWLAASKKMKTKTYYFDWLASLSLSTSLWAATLSFTVYIACVDEEEEVEDDDKQEKSEK